MPTVSVNGQDVAVGDEFMKLTPEQKNSTVDEIAKSLKTKATASKTERFETGFMDPVYGAAQIGARMTPEGAGLVGDGWEEYQKELQGTVDKTVREREQKYEKTAPQGMDWMRAAGNMVNPMNYAALPLGGITGGVATGALSGALQPATGPDFGKEKLGQIAVGGTIGGILGTAGKAIGYGVRELGSYLAREYPENVMTQAVQSILRRIHQDEKAGGVTATQAIDLINEAAKEGKPMTLADVTGKNTERLAGNVYRQGGESAAIADKFLQTRDEGAAQRMAADISKYVKGGDSMFKTTEALFKARSAAARPAYKIAMDPERIVDSPRLRQFLNDPTVKQGIGAGIESQRLEALAAGEKFNPNSAQYIVSDVNGLPVGTKGVPNMQVLDAVKRGLDAGVESERDAVTGRLSQRGVMLDRVRSAYVDELDALNPDYAAARTAWAGPSASLDALRAGRSVFKNSPEQNAADFAKLPAGQQEFYRLGVADMLRERLAKTGISGDEAKALIKNPWVRDQLKPIFRSPEDFEGFVNAVGNESKMFAKNVAIRKNSLTAERLAEDQSSDNFMAAGGAKIAENIATGSWLSAAKNAIQMWRDLGIRANPKLNEQIAKILFQTPIDAQGEVGQRLTGQFAGAGPTNRLVPAAIVAETAGGALTPGAYSGLSQLGSSPLAAQGQ
jgi:hypothetical protein